MGRKNAVERMEPETAAAVDAVIRQRRYGTLDEILGELEDKGISMSRSALGRYVIALRERDARHLGSPHDLVVVIMERSTGSTTTLTTAADKSALIAAIERLNSPL